MKLRTKFILFVVILLSNILVLSYFILKQNKLLFLASEGFVLILVLIAWQLYKQLIRPLQLLMHGTEAIKSKDFSIKFNLTGQYEMDELIKVYNQMTDELRAERTKQEQQHLFLEKLIYTSPTGILILDYDENIQQVNPRALKLLNADASTLTDKPVDSLSHPLMQEIKTLRSGETRTVTLNGSSTFKLQKSHFIDRGFTRHFIMIEELTTEILAAEKKAYGKVIRMMAHEVNNTIGPVNSIIQTTLMSDGIKKSSQAAPLEHALQVAFERNNNLSIFMRNFADVVRLPEPQRADLDLHGLIHSLSGFLVTMARDKHIDFRYELEAGAFMILADKRQMEQVLINVVKNSIEAIAEAGIITFITHPVSRQLIIADNGKGITAQDNDQLFSPFYSTKRDGQGIGLTLVKEVLINHGFEFSLQTLRPGHTAFTFRFRE
ncbi:histidine kinase [Chitinophaga flava]|uniref:histidine kinase n=2 Tax=Chitinophaga flava TaxID=2259036 RepID=A0A365XUB1_9BACT|nr:histidine kinase [Chitinophaga flava]